MTIGSSGRGWLAAVAGLAAGALLVAVVPSDLFFVRPERPAAATADERWACPMMDFIGRRAGDCPVCGMQMERVTAGELTREQQRRVGLRTSTVTAGPASVVVHAYGAAEYDERFSQVVISRIGGRIVKRHEATSGLSAELRIGDPIIDLYSPEAYQAQGELAAAIRAGNGDLTAAIEARFARWNLGHVARAIRAGGRPTDTVTILSPVAGQPYLDDQAMVDQALMVGSEIKADMPLIKVVDPRRLVLVIHVPESRIRFLRAGQPVRLASDDLGELPGLEAVIGRVADSIDAGIRAREVRIYLTDGRKSLLPGSLLEARIQAVLGADLAPADPADRTTWGSFPQIPKTAVLSTGVRHVAWRLKSRKPDGSARFEPVTLALGPRLEDEAGDDRYVIRAGLQPGDEVATQGLFLIDSQAQLAGSASLLFPDGAVGTAPVHQH